MVQAAVGVGIFLILLVGFLLLEPTWNDAACAAVSLNFGEPEWLFRLLYLCRL